MFFGTPFAVVFQFADNHIFGRGERDGFPLELNQAPMTKGPRLQLVPPGQIYIRLEARRQVKNVEMAAHFTTRLGGNYFRRRKVKVVRRKEISQPRDVLVIQENNQIHIKRQTRFAVENGGDAASDDIADARALERANE